uniref:Uncharacterized protein n=1 Tax=Rhizophora mucronata TaxID=61149 RepID=A0A2P2QQX6_RHIMU
MKVKSYEASGNWVLSLTVKDFLGSLAEIVRKYSNDSNYPQGFIVGYHLTRIFFNVSVKEEGDLTPFYVTVFGPRIIWRIEI